jgi:hypothetical protein
VQASNGSNSSREQALRGSDRGPGFIARVELEGLLHPGRGVSARVSARESESDNRGAIRCQSTNAGTRDSGKGIGCYACGNFGHVARACTVTDGYGWRRIGSGNGSRAHVRSHVGPRQYWCTVQSQRPKH